MDHIELLVATHVRDLALKIRTSDWSKAADAAGFAELTDENRTEAEKYKTQWGSENPVSNYVVRAYGLIHDIALQIRTIPMSASE